MQLCLDTLYRCRGSVLNKSDMQYRAALGKASFGLLKAAQLLLGCPAVFVRYLREGRFTARAAVEDALRDGQGALPHQH